MAVLVTAIHDLRCRKRDVDGRDKHGHDGSGLSRARVFTADLNHGRALRLDQPPRYPSAGGSHSPRSPSHFLPLSHAFIVTRSDKPRARNPNSPAPIHSGRTLMVNQTIGRRALLKGAGVVALAASGAIPLREARAQHQVRYSSGTDAAKLKAPANACDCHMHIYDSRFPVAANATLRPPDASVEDYRMLQQRTGTTRNVVVTPSTYGTAK